MVSGASVRCQARKEIIEADRMSQWNGSLNFLYVTKRHHSAIKFAEGSSRSRSATHGRRVVEPGKGNNNDDSDDRQQCPLTLSNRFQHREVKGECSPCGFHW